MTIYYVDSTKTSGGNTGADWANAFLTFEQGRAAATSDGDFIYVGHGHSESLSANTTYTFSKNVQIICVNNTGNVTGALATTALIGAQATNWSVAINGAVKLYMYGIIIKAGTGGTDKNISINTTDGGHFELEKCSVVLGSGSGSFAIFSHYGSTANSYTRLSDCTIKFGHYLQLVFSYGFTEYYNFIIDPAGQSVTKLFQNTVSHSQKTVVYNSDLSKAADYLVGNSAGSGIQFYEFYNCKLANNVTPLATATTILNKGQTTVNIYNCASGDAHYAFGHYDAFGKTEAVAGGSAIYATNGAKYDGTSGVSWKITTYGNCSYWTPYVSPWIQKYHSGTSAITPRLEVLRDGSSTAYYDDEVWAEFSYQGTPNYPLGVLVNDRMAPLGSRAPQGSSSLDSSGWENEGGTNWYGKLEPVAAITPAEIGHLMARVCVGATNATVYVDPTIRTS